MSRAASPASNQFEWTQQGNPPMSRHLLQRWDERTPSVYPSPEYAWEMGAEVSGLRYAFQDRGGQIPSRCRYYWDALTDFGVVLLVNDGICVTVYCEDRFETVTQKMLEGVRGLIRDV